MCLDEFKDGAGEGEKEGADHDYYDECDDGGAEPVEGLGDFIDENCVDGEGDDRGERGKEGFFEVVKGGYC